MGNFERDNEELNRLIEEFIRVWDGTACGSCVRNMYENGDSYEHICEAMGIEYEYYEEV